VKVKEPGVVGVPFIMPFGGTMSSPSGKEPEMIDHDVNMLLPPVAVRGWEYGVLTLPSGSDEVTILGELVVAADNIVMDRVARRPARRHTHRT
jgi:hypothetical protein